MLVLVASSLHFLFFPVFPVVDSVAPFLTTLLIGPFMFLSQTLVFWCSPLSPRFFFMSACICLFSDLFSHLLLAKSGWCDFTCRRVWFFLSAPSILGVLLSEIFALFQAIRSPQMLFSLACFSIYPKAACPPPEVFGTRERISRGFSWPSTPHDPCFFTGP